MTKGQIRVYEVEHWDDVSHAIGELRRIGVTTITAGEIDLSEESVVLTIETEMTPAEFRAKLETTDVIT